MFQECCGTLVLQSSCRVAVLYAWTYIPPPLPKASLGQDAGMSSSHVAIVEIAAREEEDFHGDNYLLHLPDVGYTPSLHALGVYNVAASRPRNGWTGAALGGVTTR